MISSTPVYPLQYVLLSQQALIAHKVSDSSNPSFTIPEKNSYLSEYDQFLLLLQNISTRNCTCPPLLEESLRHFIEILQENFNILCRNSKGEECIARVKIAQLFQALNSQPFNDESLKCVLTILDLCVEVYGSSAYNLIPEEWYQNFLECVGIPLEDQKHHTFQVILSQFRRHSLFKKIQGPFGLINDLDIRSRILSIEHRSELDSLQQRVDNCIAQLTNTKENVLPTIEFKNKFTKWDRQIKGGDHFTIRSFVSDGSNGEQELDWIISKDFPKPFCCSDGLAIPINHLLFENNYPNNLQVTPLSFSTSTAETIILRMAKVMIIDNAREKSFASLWIVLSNYIEEMRLYPAQSSLDEDVEFELWKTTVLFAGFRSNTIDLLGNSIIQLFYPTNTHSRLQFDSAYLIDEIKRIYKQVPVSQLERLRIAFYSLSKTLSNENIATLSNELAEAISKRIRDHFARREDHVIFLLIQLLDLLVRADDERLFFNISQNVLNSIELNANNSAYCSRYIGYTEDIRTALIDVKLPVSILHALFTFSSLVEASMAKLSTESCFSQTLYTVHKNTFYLQRQFRPLINHSTYRISTLLPQFNHIKLIHDWLDCTTSIAALNCFWTTFYSGLLEDQLDFSGVASHFSHACKLSHTLSIHREQIYSLIFSENASTQAFGLWMLVLLYLETHDTRDQTQLLICLPKIILNKWMGNHRKYSSKCTVLLEFILSKIYFNNSLAWTNKIETSKIEEFLYRYPLIITKDFPAIKAKLFDEYKHSALTNNDCYPTIIALFESRPKIALEFCQILQNPFLLLNQLLERYETYHNEHVLSKCVSLLNSAMFLDENSILFLKKTLELHRSNPSQLHKTSLNKTLNLFAEKGIQRLDQETKQALIIARLDIRLGHNEAIECAYLLLNEANYSIYNWNCERLETLIISILLKMEAMDTSESNACFDAILHMIPKDKIWNRSNITTMQGWLSKKPNDQDIEKWPLEQFNEHVRWSYALSKLMEYVHDNVWIQIKTALLKVLEVSEDLTKRKVTLEYFDSIIKKSLEENSLIENSSHRQFALDLLLDDSILGYLNLIPSIKIQNLNLLKQYYLSSPKIYQRIVIAIIQTLPHCSIDYIKSQLETILADVKVISEWTQAQLSLLADILIIEEFREEYWLFLDLNLFQIASERLWEKASHDLDIINSSKSITAMHHQLYNAHRYKYVSPHLGTFETTIAKLLEKLLSSSELENLAEYWIRCYLETAPEKIKQIDKFIILFPQIIRAHFKLSQRTIDHVKRFERDCTLTTITDLEKQYLMCLFEMQLWDLILEKIDSILGKTVRGITYEYGLTKGFQLIDKIAQESFNLPLDTLKKLFNVLYEKVNSGKQQQLLSIVDRHFSIYEKELSLLLFPTIFKTLNALSFHSRVDKEQWISRLGVVLPHIEPCKELLHILKSEIHIADIRISEALLKKSFLFDTLDTMRTLSIQNKLTSPHLWCAGMIQYMPYIPSRSYSLKLIELCVDQLTKSYCTTDISDFSTIDTLFEKVFKIIKHYNESDKYQESNLLYKLSNLVLAKSIYMSETSTVCRWISKFLKLHFHLCTPSISQLILRWFEIQEEKNKSIFNIEYETEIIKIIKLIHYHKPTELAVHPAMHTIFSKEKLLTPTVLEGMKQKTLECNSTAIMDILNRILLDAVKNPWDKVCKKRMLTSEERAKALDYSTPLIRLIIFGVGYGLMQKPIFSDFRKKLYKSFARYYLFYFDLEKFVNRSTYLLLGTMHIPAIVEFVTTVLKLDGINNKFLAQIAELLWICLLTNEIKFNQNDLTEIRNCISSLDTQIYKFSEFKENFLKILQNLSIAEGIAAEKIAATQVGLTLYSENKQPSKPHLQKINIQKYDFGEFEVLRSENQKCRDNSESPFNFLHVIFRKAIHNKNYSLAAKLMNILEQRIPNFILDGSYTYATYEKNYRNNIQWTNNPDLNEIKVQIIKLFHATIKSKTLHVISSEIVPDILKRLLKEFENISNDISYIFSHQVRLNHDSCAILKLAFVHFEMHVKIALFTANQLTILAYTESMVAAYHNLLSHVKLYSQHHLLSLELSIHLIAIISSITENWIPDKGEYIPRISEVRKAIECLVAEHAKKRDSSQKIIYNNGQVFTVMEPNKASLNGTREVLTNMGVANKLYYLSLEANNK